MATIEELKDVLKETLEDKGILSQIRAKIRAEIFSTLNDQSSTKPKLPMENMLINELIREYLIYNDYQHTLAVFIPESGSQPTPLLKRDQLAKKLNVYPDKNTSEFPLLYALAFAARKEHEIKITDEEDKRALRETQDEQFPYQEEAYGRQQNQQSMEYSKRTFGEDIFRQ